MSKKHLWPWAKWNLHWLQLSPCHKKPEFSIQKVRKSFWHCLFFLHIVSVDRGSTDAEVVGTCSFVMLNCLECGCGTVVLEWALSVLSRSWNRLPIYETFVVQNDSIWMSQGREAVCLTNSALPLADQVSSPQSQKWNLSFGIFKTDWPGLSHEHSWSLLPIPGCNLC